jgi:hypothetical protein
MSTQTELKLGNNLIVVSSRESKNYVHTRTNLALVQYGNNLISEVRKYGDNIDVVVYDEKDGLPEHYKTWQLLDKHHPKGYNTTNA